MEYSQCKQLLQIEFVNYELYFFITPTWEINSNFYPQLNCCDFALGCLDYLREFQPEYFSCKEYLNGYRLIKKMIDLTTVSQTHTN